MKSDEIQIGECDGEPVMADRKAFLDHLVIVRAGGKELLRADLPTLFLLAQVRGRVETVIELTPGSGITFNNER